VDNLAFVAPVAESVDAADSKSAAERCASSSPSLAPVRQEKAFSDESLFLFRERISAYVVDRRRLRLSPAPRTDRPAPRPERSGSRLLHVCGQQQINRQFADLPGLLRAGDLLVFNDTRVIKARFFGQKETGGQVEVLLERIVDATHAIAQIRASKSPKPGTRIKLADAFEVMITGRAGASGEFFALELVDPWGQPRLPWSQQSLGTGRAVRQTAAAALYRTPTRRCGRNPLSNRLRPRTRRGCGADCRPAFR
jgi:hypothetical protein